MPQVEDVQEYLTRALEVLLDKMKLVNPKLVITLGAKNGESYSGMVYRVSADSEEVQASDDKDAMDHQIQLIAKVPPTLKERYDRFNSVELFQREEYAYDVIFPAFEHFQQPNLTREESFYAYPLKYDSFTKIETGEYIILNDLRANRYEKPFYTMPRTSEISYEKCVLVLKNLARFHAISVGMKANNPIALGVLSKPLDDVIFTDKNIMPSSMISKLARKTFEEFIPHSKLDPVEDAELIKKLKVFDNDFCKIMRSCTNSDGDSAVIHGDCWISNLMFRGDKEIRFLDWQCMRFASVAIDLSHFMFCSTSQDVRAQMDDLIYKVYLGTLQSNVQKLTGTKCTFSEELLRKEMHKYGKFGVGMAVLTLHANTCEDLNDVQMMLNSLNVEERILTGNSQLLRREPYLKRMEEVIRDADRLGYLDSLIS